jgi:hypothetical protein
MLPALVITRGVSHCGVAICIFKRVSEGKKKNYENSKVSPCKNIMFKKHPLKETFRAFRSQLTPSG